MTIDPGVESDYVFSHRFPTRVPVYRDIAQWSAAARGTQPARLDVPYGGHERERIDLFPGGAGAPLLVFFHGGYWRSQDKASYGFVAAAARALGCGAAIVGYPLAPQRTLAEVVGSCRQALQWLRGPGQAHLSAAGGIVLAGHSAGGHLASLLASDADPDGDVIGCVALSGIFDLRPLVRTSIGLEVGLDAGTAGALSPIARPAGRGWLIAAVGSLETPGFLQQTRRYAAHWSQGGASAMAVELEGADHYSILREWMRPDGALLCALRLRLEARCGAAA